MGKGNIFYDMVLKTEDFPVRIDVNHKYTLF